MLFLNNCILLKILSYKSGDSIPPRYDLIEKLTNKPIAAFNGGSSVGSGQKVTASLRIRANEQLLKKSPIHAGLYDGGLLIRPDLFFAG
ncbi:hypothetical protein GCK32_005819 [Trichostrongylus colubriformis]|uniref:Uncharacterized protein n=1 Tax=Trichostrongylus colubriformis TaxID=6319 RepID=A0AAN8FY09_TRICO